MGLNVFAKPFGSPNVLSPTAPAFVSYQELKCSVSESEKVETALKLELESCSAKVESLRGSVAAYAYEAQHFQHEALESKQRADKYATELEDMRAVVASSASEAEHFRNMAFESKQRADEYATELGRLSVVFKQRANKDAIELAQAKAALQMQADNYEDRVKCPMCCENDNNVALAPCGHLLCRPCYDMIRASKECVCPTCRKTIHATLKIFL